MHSDVHYTTKCSSRAMDEDVHIYNGILLSHKRNEIDSFVETHTEWSQEEKNKYHILTHICGI